jgi:hypothetical protein
MTYGNNNEKYNVSSRDYEYARILISTIPVSEETKRKISEAMKGEKNPMFGKPGTRLGIKDSKETKYKKRKTKLGRNNPQWGKKGELSTNWNREFSTKTLEKMSIAQKNRFSKKTNHPRYGKKLSEETKDKIRQTLLNKNI